MYQVEQPGLPKWGKVVVGLVIAAAVLAIAVGVIGAIFFSRFFRVIQSESSGIGDTVFDSSLRWQRGILVADVSASSVSGGSAGLVKITSVALNDIASDRSMVTAKRGTTLSFPFHKFKGNGGDQERITIKYESSDEGSSGYESSTIDVPGKPDGHSAE